MNLFYLIMSTAVQNIKYYLHISMIKKFPNGITNRHATYDQFIEGMKYKNIKTYKDFILKTDEMMKVKVYISEKDESKIFATYSKARKNLVWTKMMIIPLERKDDKEIGENYEHKTLLSFAKESLKEKRPHHRYFLGIILAIMMNLFTYFFFIFGNKMIAQETLRPVNPEAL